MLEVGAQIGLSGISGNLYGAHEGEKSALHEICLLETSAAQKRKKGLLKVVTPAAANCGGDVQKSR